MFEDFTDEELMAIANQGTATQKRDFSQFSDEELMEIAAPTFETEQLPTGAGFTAKKGLADIGQQFTPKNLWEGLRKDAVHFYAGLADTENKWLVNPVATAFDFYAEKAGLKDTERKSALRKISDNLESVAGLEQEAAGPPMHGESIAGGIARGAGGAAVVMPILGALNPALGIHALPAMSAVEASSTGDPKEVAKAALTGYLLVGGLKAAEAMPKGFKVPAAATVFGGITAAEGGDLNDTIASAILGGALAFGGNKGRSVKDIAKDVKSDIKSTSKSIKDSQWFRKLTIKERALATQRVGDVAKGMRASGMTDGEVLRTIKRVYGVDSPDFKQAWDEIAVRSGRIQEQSAQQGIPLPPEPAPGEYVPPIEPPKVGIIKPQEPVSTPQQAKTPPPIPKATPEAVKPSEGVEKAVEQMTPEEVGSVLIQKLDGTEDQVFPQELHIESVKRAIEGSKPVSVTAVDEYNIDLPEGWTRKGDLYVPPEIETQPPQERPKPDTGAAKAAGEVLPSDRDITPEEAKQSVDVPDTAQEQSNVKITAAGMPATFGLNKKSKLKKVGLTRNPVDFILKFAKEIPEFSDNPVFTVKNGKLQFKDHFQYNLNPEIVGLDPKTLTEGQEIPVDLQEMTESKKLRTKIAKQFSGMSASQLRQEGKIRNIQNSFNEPIPSLRAQIIQDEFIKQTQKTAEPVSKEEKPTPPAKKAKTPTKKPVSKTAQTEPVANAGEKVQTLTVPEALQQGKPVKPPKGATFVRVTTPDGKSAVVPTKDMDTLADAGPFKAVEFGTRGKKGFVAMDDAGEVVGPKIKPITNVPKEFKGNFVEKESEHGRSEIIETAKADSGIIGASTVDQMIRMPDPDVAVSSTKPLNIEDMAEQGGFLRIKKDDMADTTKAADKLTGKLITLEEHRANTDEFTKALEELDGAQRLALQKVHSAFDRRRSKLPEKSWDKIGLWLRYHDEQVLVEKYKDKVPAYVRRILEDLDNLTDDEMTEAMLIKDELAQWGELLKTQGVNLKNFYVPQLTVKNKGKGYWWQGRGKKAFAKPSRHTKKRTFNDGVLEVLASENYSPQTLNAAALLAEYQKAAIIAQTEKAFIDSIKNMTNDEGKRALMPADVVAGDTDYVQIDHPALTKHKVKSFHRTETGIYGKGKTPLDVESGEEFALTGETKRPHDILAWQTVPLKVHKDIAKRLNTLLQGSLVRQIGGLKQLLTLNAVGKYAILSFSGFHHAALFKTGAFYGALDWNKGLNLIADGDPTAERLVKIGGLTTTSSQLLNFAKEVANRGIKQLEGSKIPVVRQIGRGWLQAKQYWDKGLWDHYYVGLKVLSAKKEYFRNLNRYKNELHSGKMTDEDILKITAEDVNDNFGGLNWRRMEISPTAQDMMRIALLAPDWTLSNWRFFLKATKLPGTPSLYDLAQGMMHRGEIPIFDESGKIKGYAKVKPRFQNRSKGAGRYMMKVIIAIGGITAVINKINNGRWLPDDEERWYMIQLPDRFFLDEMGRAYYFDGFGHFFEPVKAVSDPPRWLAGKKAFGLSLMMDMFTQKNWRGDYIGNLDDLKEWHLYRSKYKRYPKSGAFMYKKLFNEAIHAGKTFLPIPLSGLVDYGFREKTGAEAITQTLGVPIRRGSPFAWIKDEDIRSKLIRKQGARIKEIKEKFKDDPDGLHEAISDEKRRLLKLKNANISGRKTPPKK